MTVRFLHIRNVDDREMGTSAGKGGTTVAYYTGMLNEQTPAIEFAVARCSDRDNYNRKIGRTIAEGRLRKRHNVVTLEIGEMKPIQAILEHLYG